MSGDDWETLSTISDEGAHLVAEYGVASFDYGQARLGPNDILPELQRRTEARSALKAYIAQLETAAAYQKTLARTAASQARNYQALYQEANPSSPPPPSPPEEGPGPRLSVEMQRDLARAMGYNIPATPSSPETTWKELATAYTRIGSVEDCAYWKELAHGFARNADEHISVSGSHSGSVSDATLMASSPETPAELSTLIDGLLWTFEDDGSESESHAAARSALMALYNRQREEIAEWKELYSKVADDANSLSSQLKASVARFDDDVASIAYWSKRAIEAESSVERLKAEQPKFTQEDATRVRDWAICWSHRPFYDLADRIESALRLQSGKR